MGISKSGCSSSITKEDLENMYKQGFVEGYKHCQENLTVYDVEAVVKELEEYMDENKHETNSGFIEVCIDIVRNGGVK